MYSKLPVGSLISVFILAQNNQICKKEIEMLENRMVTDDYIETNNDYDSYLEHLLEKDDEYWEEGIDD